MLFSKERFELAKKNCGAINIEKKILWVGKMSVELLCMQRQVRMLMQDDLLFCLGGISE